MKKEYKPIIEEQVEIINIHYTNKTTMEELTNILKKYPKHTTGYIGMTLESDGISLTLEKRKEK